MTTDSVRASLRRACEEIEDVCASAPVSETDRLAGIAEQLRHVAEGSTTDPEAPAYPDPGAIDTIQGHLAEVIAGTDDEEVARRLGRARDELLLAISMLDVGLDRQRDAPSGTE